MQIEIRLIENRLQLTKFQYFQRTLLDFNGIAMSTNIELLVFYHKEYVKNIMG